ncbi:MAG: GyrI-like domain-containing protein [Chloroflexi bacterium]|nr:GyrI-like domain-containing protein [Chloroflexota bacterium]
MLSEITIKEQPTQPTLSLRTRTTVQDLPQLVGRVYGAVTQYLGELGEPPAGPPFVIYYNMDLQDLDLELGFPVSKVFPGKGEIKASEFPGGRVATCLYTGPYPECGSAYEALGQWVKDKGYETTGLAYEVYLNSPAEVSPQDLETVISFPLK